MQPNTTPPLLPQRIRKGDTIGLFCPAGPVRDTALVEQGIKIITDAGFLVKLGGRLNSSHAYLAATDEQRVQALHNLWADETVKALMAIRGGYGCLRLINTVDTALISRYPKLLIGFSDVSVLLNGLLQEANLVSIHGPSVSTLARIDKASIAAFFSMITGSFTDHVRPEGIEILRAGNMRGQLIGGNLTTLVHLLGTRWDMPWDGRLLFIEDTGETMYRLDRMLTQLKLAGRLENLAGLILGTFDLGGDDRLDMLRLQEALWDRVLELTDGLPYPVWSNYPIGHQQRNHSLPVGLEATMDSDRGRLAFHPESASQK